MREGAQEWFSVLRQKLRVVQKCLEAGWCVTLPTEAQWEWAARGAERDVFPGGRSLTPDRASFDETGIGATSAVGCFPGGGSWCGTEELSTNVWEWMRS